MLDNPNFREGLNVYQGKVTHEAVARDLGYDFVEPTQALSSKERQPQHVPVAAR